MRCARKPYRAGAEAGGNTITVLLSPGRPGVPGSPGVPVGPGVPGSPLAPCGPGTGVGTGTITVLGGAGSGAGVVTTVVGGWVGVPITVSRSQALKPNTPTKADIKRTDRFIGDSLCRGEATLAA